MCSLWDTKCLYCNGTQLHFRVLLVQVPVECTSALEFPHTVDSKNNIHDDAEGTGKVPPLAAINRVCQVDVIMRDEHQRQQRRL
jgi:hypothetical protein